MTDLPSPIDVQTWQQVCAFLGFMAVVVALPSVLTYLGNRRVKNVEKTLTEPNGGSSVRDAINRVEETLVQIDRRLAAVEQEQKRTKKRRLFG